MRGACVPKFLQCAGTAGALAVTELPWMLTPWSWKTEKCGLGAQLGGFLPGRITPTSLMYYPKSGPGDGCLTAFYEFWFLLLQLPTCNQAWGMGIFISRKAAAGLKSCCAACSRTAIPSDSSLVVWHSSVWRKNVHMWSTLLGASTFVVVSANCSRLRLKLCCDMGTAG